MMRFVLLLLATLSLSIGCARPAAEAPKKTGTIEAKFVPENPHFPPRGTPHPDSEKESAAKAYFNELKGETGPIIEAAGFRIPILDIPFGLSQHDVEVALPAGWRALPDPTRKNDGAPAVTGMQFALYEVAAIPEAGLTDGPFTLTFGFLNDTFEQLDIQIIHSDGQQQQLAEQMLAALGPGILIKGQEPDANGGVFLKWVNLMWQIGERNQSTGAIHFDLTYRGPQAGSATTLLTPTDWFDRLVISMLSPTLAKRSRTQRPTQGGTAR